MGTGALLTGMSATGSVASGDYYVYALINDGKNTPRDKILLRRRFGVDSGRSGSPRPDFR